MIQFMSDDPDVRRAAADLLARYLKSKGGSDNVPPCAIAIAASLCHKLAVKHMRELYEQARKN